MLEKFLIVSLGSIGRRHLDNLRYLKPESKIGILHLNSKNQAIPSGADYCFFDLNSAINFKPNAAIVCCPASFHIEIAQLLIDNNIPTFIEKPISDKLEGLDRLLKKSSDSGILLSVGYNLEFLPSLIKTKSLLNSGLIGEIFVARVDVGQYLPDWRPNITYQNSVSAKKELGGGVLLELSHEIDYIYSLFGVPDKVSASGGTFRFFDINVEDIISLNMTYKFPLRLVNIHLDFLQREPCRMCKFIGSEGTIIWNGLTNEIIINHSNTDKSKKLTNLDIPNKNYTYVRELEHFLSCVFEGTKPKVDAYRGRDVLFIIEAAKSSLRTGREVSLK